MLLLWQILVSLGFGDRRFIPTPSDIAARFWQLTVSGELEVNTMATLWRVVAGFVIGQLLAGVFGMIAGVIAGKTSGQITSIASAPVPPEWYVVSTLLGLWIGQKLACPGIE